MLNVESFVHLLIAPAFLEFCVIASQRWQGSLVPNLALGMKMVTFATHTALFSLSLTFPNLRRQGQSKYG